MLYDLNTTTNNYTASIHHS